MNIDKKQESALIEEFMSKEKSLFDNWMWFDKSVTFEAFTQLKWTQETANEMVDILKKLGIKTTYNNLTNRNDHFLVGILTFNWFFNKSLTKSEIEEIKKIKVKTYTEYRNK